MRAQWNGDRRDQSHMSGRSECHDGAQRGAMENTRHARQELRWPNAALRISASVDTTA